MSYTGTIELFSGDTAPELAFTIYDEVTGAGADLTALPNPEVQMTFRAIGGADVATLTLTQVDAAIGRVSVSWGATLVDLAEGAYEGVVQILADAGYVRTVSTYLRFQVKTP